VYVVLHIVRTGSIAYRHHRECGDEKAGKYAERTVAPEFR